MAAGTEPTAPIRLLEAALAPPADRMPTEAAVRTAVERAFDIETLARAVLAGQPASASQFEKFRKALTQRLVLDMLDQRRREGSGTLSVLRTREIGAGEWVVDTRIVTRAKKQRTTSWRVGERLGRAAITDVMSNGASLARSLRNSYGASLRKHGLDGLITRMEARNQETRG
jgi:ABC-type transporter MlaC component